MLRLPSNAGIACAVPAAGSPVKQCNYTLGSRLGAPLTAVRQQADEVQRVLRQGGLDVLEAVAAESGPAFQRDVHQPRTLQRKQHSLDRSPGASFLRSILSAPLQRDCHQRLLVAGPASSITDTLAGRWQQQEHLNSNTHNRCYSLWPDTYRIRHAPGGCCPKSELYALSIIKGAYS